MSSTPWFKFYPGDYLADTRRLTRSQHGAYLLILIDYFATGEAPPNDDLLLARLTLCDTQSEWLAIRKVIAQYFEITDVWLNSRCEKELLARRSEHTKKSEAGKKGNEIKWGTSRSDTESDSLNDRNTRSQKLDVRSKKLEVIDQKSETSKTKSNTLSPDKSGDTEMQAACRLTWKHFTNAYFKRYNIEPVKNAKVFSVIKLFVARIGFADAPYVAEFFVNHNERFYVQRSHPVDSMLKDCEGLRTQWATNRPMTSTQAHQLDKTASNFDSIQQAKLMMRSRDENR